MIDLIEIRCDGERPRGRTRGQKCSTILLRVEPATSGVIETRCPKCYKMQMWSLPRVRYPVGSTA